MRDLSWDVAVDVGGTFVDLVARPSDGGVCRLAKHLRGSADPASSVADALATFLRDEGIAAEAVARLRHGTTIATNALLEGREPPVALFTTCGFADVLTLGRQHRRDLDAPRPDPPVPLGLCPEELRFELPERVDAQGRIVLPLDPAALEAALDAFAMSVAPGRPMPAVAVALLFAPLAPAHERLVGAALKARWPALHLSLSHEVDPRLREFERTLSTVLDASIRPAVSGYLDRLRNRIATMGLPAPLLMRSAGGLAPIEAVSQAPATLAMSGPAAAAVAVRETAAFTDFNSSSELLFANSHDRSESAPQRGAGFRSVIGIDIGGTSADLAFVADGALLTTSALVLGQLELRVPSADIASVAIGGGSLLRLTGGLLRVGPHSAGSHPGPACYGRGGADPTLTDAALAAGLFPAWLGSGLGLDRAAAVGALATGLDVTPEDGPAIGLEAVQVAEAVVAEGLRRKAFALGLDPRDALLVAGGGGGALHAAAVADRVGAKRVLVPPAPGVLATIGLLQAGLRDGRERPVDRPLDEDALRRLEADAAVDAEALRQTVSNWADPELDNIAVCHELELGYEGQGFGLTVPYRPGHDDADTLASRFDARHRRLRGHALGGARRIVALRSTAARALGPEERIVFAPPPTRPIGAPPTHRAVAADPPFDCPVWRRSELPTGARLSGPALVDASDTTIAIPVGWVADLLPDGSLLLAAAEPAR